jgi:hypothetical protein
VAALDVEARCGHRFDPPAEVLVEHSNSLPRLGMTPGGVQPREVRVADELDH